MYGFTPLKFLEFGAQFFCLSEKDDFNCHTLINSENGGSKIFCKKVSYKNLYSHIIRCHLKLPTCRMPESDTVTCFTERSVDFLPFNLSPVFVSPKPENLVVLRKLERLNLILADQKAKGIGFFYTVEKAKNKKQLESQEKPSDSKAEKNSQKIPSHPHNDITVIGTKENCQKSSLPLRKKIKVEPRNATVNGGENESANLQGASDVSGLSIEELVSKEEIEEDFAKRSVNNSLQSADESVDQEDVLGNSEVTLVFLNLSVMLLL